MTTDPFLEQLTAIRGQLADLLAGKVTYRSATVTAADAGTSTFTAVTVTDGQVIDGLPSNAQQLPQVGQEVRLRLEGAKPVYEPAGIAADAVTSRELAPGAVTSDNLAADVLNQLGDGALLYRQATQPAAPASGRTAYWFDTSGDGNAVMKVYDAGTDTWDVVPFGEGAIGPNSLHASAVLVDGSVVASLLESVLVLASVIIAGDPTGTHAAMQPDGFHVYDADGNEVIRLGTTDNDYFGVVNSAGDLLASIDDTGQGNLTGLNVNSWPVINGVALDQTLDAIPGDAFFGAQAGAVIAGVSTEVGLLEVPCTMIDQRLYYFVPGLEWTRSTSATYLKVRVRDGGTSAPTVSSPQVFEADFTGDATLTWGELATIMRPVDWRSGAGLHRFLLTVTAGGGGTVDIINVNTDPNLAVLDFGPYSNAGLVNRGGGSAGSGTKDYYTGNIAPSGNWTYRGNGVLRTDTTNVVQGLDPSGFNGDGQGGWNFPIPNISGTVNKVVFYMYNTFSYFNSGGKAKIRLVGSSATFAPTVLQPTWIPAPTYPKPGGVAVQLPSSWNASFTGKTSIGIYLGPGGSDETYYIRPDGPSARLQIWYTE